MYEEIYETYKEVAEDNINRDLFTSEKESNEALIEDIKNNKLVIYTAFTGDYDTLKDPEVIDENCDYICFSDNPNLKSDIWEIRPMEESTLDNNRKAKQYKVLPHVYLPDYKYSFWLDGTFKIKGSIREYIYKFLKKDSNMLNVVHTERDCVYDEYDASKIIPRYPRAVMEEQVNHYEKEGFPKKYGLAVMGAIFREHNDPKIIKLMEDWWDEIIKFTNQDQLSFAYVAWKNDFHPSVSLIYYWDNEYWAKEGEYHHNFVFQTPITSDNLRAKIGVDVENMELGDTLELSREELYLLVNDVKGMAGYRLDTAGRIGFLNNELNAMYNSNSLKITKPLRALRHLKPNRIKFESSSEEKIYNRIKDLNLINTDVYHRYHSDVPLNLSILDFIRNGASNDSNEIKYEYYNPLFDLYFYKEQNELDSEDPIIHYVTKGYFKKAYINNNEEDFVKSLESPLEKQHEKYVKSLISNEICNNHYIHDDEVLIPYIEGEETFPTDTIKVGVFLEDAFDNMNACPFIRIHTIFKELSKSNDYHFFVYGKETIAQLDMDNIIKNKIFDVIVIQRVNPFSTELMKRAKRLGIKVVYETDDDLFDLSSNNPSYEYIKKNKDNLSKFLQSADVVVTSTDELAKRIKKIKDTDIEVIRNYHTSNITSLKPFKHNKNIKIGYFGTLTHSADLELVRNVIPRVQEMLPDIDIELEVVGVSMDEDDWYTTEELPYYPMSAATFSKWLHNTVEWDIGIAPLVKTDFNQCKSELKYIEYTALGIPTLASDVGGYLEAITDGVNGYLANNEDEWVDKLSILVKDPTLRNGMVNNARSDILENYSLNKRVKQWDKIFKSFE